MTKYKFEFNKLVRDLIKENMQERGSVVKSRILSDNEYLHELKKKLLEEVNEAVKTDKVENLLEELADVQEVVDNLILTLKYSKENLIAAQDKKNLKNGSFKKKIFIDWVKIDENDEWFGYFKKNYKEIK